MNEGYIKLWRKSLDSGLLKNPHLWTFWCWCLMKATWKPIKQMVGNQMIELMPGQFVFGRKSASEELEVGEKIIRSRLDILKNLGNVAIKPTNKFSIITICNWDIYQSDDTTKDQQSGQQRANNGPTTGHKQEVKEVQELKENTLAPSRKKTTATAPDDSPVILTFPMIDNTEYPITENVIKEMQPLFPAINVENEFRKMKAWLTNNPNNRKKNVKKFYNAWLSRAQDKAPVIAATAFTPFSERKGAERILK